MTRATSVVGWTRSPIIGVDRIDAVVPAPGRRRQLAALADAPVLADRARDPVEFASQPLVQLDDVVERFCDLAIDAGQVQRQAGREVPLPKRAKALQEELRLQAGRGRRHSDTPSESMDLAQRGSRLGRGR